ncbi:MAG: magnesium transporter [Candidatus Saccharibacteria bacterium]|nr:magnesium transporter [Candidatus Saccharibacteria bacterium]
MSKNSEMPKPQKLHGLFGIFAGKQLGTVVNAPTSSIIRQNYKGFEWIDLENPKEEDLLAIASKYNLHDVQIRQAHNKGQISQVVIEDDYIFLILHFPYTTVGEQRIASSQVSIFLGKNYLVTIHDHSTPTIRQCFNEHKDDHGEDKSQGKIVFHLIEHLLKDVDLLLAGVSTDLDEIEERVFNDARSDAFEIGILRQKIMRLRRTLAMQKSVLEELDGAIDKFTGEHLARYYRSNTNVTRKLWETVEEARESIEIYKDADFTTSTEQTNKILEALTLVFTLTIPATLIGSLYGMNVLLPGGIETGSWTFLGDYTMFKLIITVSVLAAVSMLLYFKYKKWS